MKKFILLGLGILVALSLSTLAFGQGEEKFKAELRGANERPSRVTTTAQPVMQNSSSMPHRQ